MGCGSWDYLSVFTCCPRTAVEASQTTNSMPLTDAVRAEGLGPSACPADNQVSQWHAGGGRLGGRVGGRAIMELNPVQDNSPDPDATGDVQGRMAPILLLLCAALAVALSAVWAVLAVVAGVCAYLVIRLDRRSGVSNSSVQWSAWAIIVGAVLSAGVQAGLWLSSK